MKFIKLVLLVSLIMYFQTSFNATIDFSKHQKTITYFLSITGMVCCMARVYFYFKESRVINSDTTEKKDLGHYKKNNIRSLDSIIPVVENKEENSSTSGENSVKEPDDDLKERQEKYQKILNQQLRTVINKLKELIDIDDHNWNNFLEDREKKINEYLENLQNPLIEWYYNSQLEEKNKSWIEKWLNIIKIHSKSVNYDCIEADINPYIDPEYANALLQQQPHAQCYYDNATQKTTIKINQNKEIAEVIIIHELGHLLQGDPPNDFIFEDFYKKYNMSFKQSYNTDARKNFKFWQESIADRKIAIINKEAAAKLVVYTINQFLISTAPYQRGGDRESRFVQMVHACDLWKNIYNGSLEKAHIEAGKNQQETTEFLNQNAKKIEDIYNNADDAEWIVKRIKDLN